MVDRVDGYARSLDCHLLPKYKSQRSHVMWCLVCIGMTRDSLQPQSHMVWYFTGC